MAKKRQSIEDALREHLRKLGAQGGNAAAANLTGPQRTRRAKLAAAARWNKKKGGK